MDTPPVFTPGPGKSKTEEDGGADIDDDFLDDVTVWEDGAEKLLAPGVNLLKVRRAASDTDMAPWPPPSA